jgi:hypothetical protein
MDLEDAARQSGIIPPERVASLVSLLKAPDFRWLLTPPHPAQSRLQGDLLSEFPLALVGADGNPKCTSFTVLVLNNTCDLQPNRSDFVTVAPVLDFDAFSQHVIRKRGEARASNYLRDVMANKVYEMLWLPAFGSFSKGAVVLLDKMGAVSSTVYESALAGNRRLASFSQPGFYFLLVKLTKHLARPESEEVVRNN